MLTFGIEKSESPEICIVVDINGIAKLRHILEALSKSPDHAHLMTEEWGGNDLTIDGIDSNYSLINSVRIVRI